MLDLTNHLAFLLVTWLVFFVSAVGLGEHLRRRISGTNQPTGQQRSRDGVLGVAISVLLGYGAISFITYDLAAKTWGGTAPAWAIPSNS